MGPDSQTTLARSLDDLLDLNQTADGFFYSRHHLDNHRGVIFGGQILSQALVAATSTSEGKSAHSISAAFLSKGDSRVPIEYRVVPLRDGRSFNSRRVDAIQHKQTIFSMQVSFHRMESGFRHQTNAPKNIPPPDSLPDLTEHIDQTPYDLSALLAGDRYLEIRPFSVAGYLDAQVIAPNGGHWFKPREAIPNDAARRFCALAFASDRSILATCALSHPVCVFDPKVTAVTLNHAVWFHADYNANDWMLYVYDSPWAGGGRGLNMGSIYSPDGTLVATSAQESLLRQSR
jgi:acyl-CoA thioesterase-2